MTKRIPQRDVNLAREMMRQGQQLISQSIALLDPSKVIDYNWQSDAINALLGLIGDIREHKRKISHIELKGQRG